ncbi:MAG: hypothetical protein ACC657_04140 [Thiohalomonadales bacterium]
MNNFTKTLYQFKYLILFLMYLSFIFSSDSYADIIIITNENSPINEISETKLKKLWLGKTKKIKSIGRIYIIDLPENNTETRIFYKNIINKKPKQVKAYWAKISFIGKGFPPKVVEDDSAVIKWVLEKNNRIGYINSKSKTKNIKILYTIVEHE